MTKPFDHSQPSPATSDGAGLPDTGRRQDAAPPTPVSSAPEALAGLLLSDPAVDECVVLLRAAEPVAYVVVAAPHGDFGRVERRLRDLSAGRVAAFVPLARLPLTEDGGVDHAALERLPVRSAATDAAWEARIAAVPDIDRVVCVSGYAEAAPRHVHVGGLLRTPAAETPAPPRSAHAAAAPERVGPVPEALCHGGPLPGHEGAVRTLPELLLAAPAQATIIYIDADGAERAETYGALLEEARCLLGGLRLAGLAAGDKVVLQLERNDDILPALWACLLGGFEPAIVPVPLAYDTDSRALEHLRHLWNLFDRPLVLTTRSRGAGLAAALPVPVRLAAIEELRGHPPDSRVHAAEPGDVAFYCLSSGSTGLPKAVALTHGNLLARARGANALCGNSSADVILNWLPFDHIGSISDWHLRCVALGCALVYAPKEYVLARPLRWLELLHRYRVTHSWAPNFAYSLVSAALKSGQRPAFDLSQVKMLLTAGESVTRAATGEFLGELAAYGLAPSALQTAFGMVEVCSGVSYHQPHPGQSLAFHHIDRNSLGGAVRPADPGAADCVSFASLGPVIPGMSMRIVDEQGRVLPEAATGRLHLKGEALSPGYYRNPEANRVFLADGWFDTGDTGFIVGGELFITGRADAGGIIVNGANFYSSEIEAVVEQVAGLAPSFTAACAVRPSGGEAEKLAVFFHTEHTDDAFLGKLLKAIQARLAKQLGIKADFLVPLPRAALPKTAIGKIQHKQLVAQFHQGAFRETVERLDVLAGNEHTVPDRFHRRAWRRKSRPHGPAEAAGACLVFLDQGGLGRRVAARLAEAGVACVTVAAGAGFAQAGAGAWTIRPDEPADYRELAAAIQAAGLRLDGILHLSGHGAGRAETLGTGGLGGLLALVQALGSPAPLKLLAVSGGTDASDAAGAALPGLLRALERDFPGLRCLHADGPGEGLDALATALADELLAPSADREIAFREGRRWVAGLARAEIAAAPPELPFRRRGVYAVAGELGGLGLLLAEFLLARYEARLLILCDGPDSAGRLGRAGFADAAAQGDCVILGVDAADADALVRAVAAPLARWEAAALDGVIHLAAVRPLAEETPETLSALLAAEIAAARSLEQLLAAYPCGLFVSLAPAAGYPGSHDGTGSAATASFHDAFAARLERRGDVQVHGLGLAFWLDPALAPVAEGPASAAARRAFNALLAGLRLGPGRFLVGLDDNRPDVRARCFDGSPELLRTTAYFTSRRPVPLAPLRALRLLDAYGVDAACDFRPLREPEAAGSEQVELWPSVAEYFVYDELIYYALANDERRNRSYRVALDKAVPGKIVLDLGTGKEAILARLALAAGAHKVYAIERGDEAYRQAVDRVRQLGLDDRIFVFHGDATEVELPEPVDVCVSEIVGPIGGCEGAAVLINNGHRFLRPGGLMIPGRSVTKIAAARFPDELLSRLGFYRVPGSYTGKIFDEVGHPFDLRVCVKKFPRGNLLSNADIFEDLDFNRPIALEETHAIELRIDRPSRFDGFLVWLNLHTIEGEVIDILEHEYSWLPVYLPVFHPGVEVVPGDRIVATLARTLCENRLNPDFTITGSLLRRQGESLDFVCTSYHFRDRYRQHPFYQQLFADDPLGLHPGCRQGDVLQHLDEMPLTAAGAADRDRLRERAAGQGRGAGKHQSPLSGLELHIAEVWREVLEIADVGVHDSFFELGGHSLLLVRVLDRLVGLFGPRITLVDLFKYPTIHALAQVLADDGPRETASQKGQERAAIRGRQLSSAAGRDIAVIGMACRFPGADDPEAFWRNLVGGVESVTFFDPRDIAASGIDPEVARHPDYVRASPVLSDVEGFDAEFFGYSARDAELMDPQHRLFLEVCWEAFEDAGYDPTAYPGVVGVYAGASMNTYLLNNVMPHRASLDALDDLDVTTLDSMGGFQLMVAADKDYLTTRVSYKLNLRGTSVNVQTACSTGLVAVHMACQSLLAGEADMFLAGGSSVQVPQRAGHLYQGGMIVSPDGHCRAFDAEAKGTVFGSGVGAVLLKRLDAALADGDPVYAVIKGSAVNNDGGLKVGYMAPSGDGEASVAAEALAMAGVAADSIGFVEAHGTGTEIGDPIEVNALAQAFRAHTDRKGYCAIGSVKTNVGHLQIASGVVGFMKAALALHHKTIPPTLHYKTPNPAIDFDNSPFYVNTAPVDWPSLDTPRRAGVNSLGIGGTNSHLILEEAPPAEDWANAVERPRHLLLLSARTEPALAELARRYAALLAARPGTVLADLCFTANTGRKPFEQRLAVAAESAAQLRADLEAVAAGANPERVARGAWNGQNRPKVAFLFTGQGSQYPGMGRELYDTEPAFRRSLDQCAEILRPLLGRPLLEILYPEGGAATPLDDTAYAQPALFALDYALAALWQSWGVAPDAVLGHSLGEYAAACVAGVFSLEDGLKLVAERARLMQALPRDGGMASVFAGEAEVRPFLAGHAHDIAVAAENGPGHVVLSGRTEALAAVLDRLRAAGHKTQALNTSHAFHSPLMEPMLAGFYRAAQSVAYAEPKIPLACNVTGEWADEEIATPEYWRRHIRQPVKFMAGMQSLARQGIDIFIEVGPKPTLLGMGARCLPAGQGVWLPSLRQGSADWATLLDSLARLAVAGPVDFAGFDREYRRRRVPLPTYPFQRRRHWLDRPVAPHTAHAGGGGHPLLGRKLRMPALAVAVYENRFDAQALPFLRDHRIHGEVVVSGASHVAMLLAAAAHHFGKGQYGVKNLYFPAPLVIPEHEAWTVQTVLTPTAAGEASAQLLSFAEDGMDHSPAAATHAEGGIHWGPLPAAAAEPFAAVWARCREDIPVDGFFRAQAERRIHLGPSYRWIEALRRGGGETVCRLRPPESMGGLHTALHPGLLDACFGLMLATGAFPEGETWMPFAIEDVRVYREIGDLHLWGHLRLRPADGSGRRVADAKLCDESGQVLIEFIGFEARPASLEAIARQRRPHIDSLLHTREWRPAALAPQAADAPGSWLVFADGAGLAADLAERLRARGERCALVVPGADYAALEPDLYRVNPAAPQDFERLLRDSGACRGVVHLWSLDEPWGGEAAWLSQTLSCASALHLIQALVRCGWQREPRLWLVTRGAQPVGAATPALQQTALWGLALAAALEHPELACVAVDLDPAVASDAAELDGELFAAGEERQIAWRQGVRHVARLVRQRTSAAPGKKPPVRADATYLITGGTGGLGLCAAADLVEQGARHLVLLSRRAATPEALEAIRRLELAGAQVSLTQADVSNRETLAAVFERVRESLPPLRGVLHCAGLIQDGMMADMDWERFRQVFPPKIDGAWHLHELTRHLDLDFFVLFSSAASLLGNPGQANYAAANAFLDGLAHYRRHLGLAATSVNWGPWDQVGIAASDAAITGRMSRMGFVGLKPEAALEALRRILAAGAVQSAVIDWDSGKYLAQLPTPRHYFAELADAPPEVSKDATPDILRELEGAPPDRRKPILAAMVRTAVQRILGGCDLDGTKPFTEQGLDSLMAVQLRNAISDSVGQSLPVSLAFNHPSVDEVAAYLQTLLGMDAPPARPASPQPESAATAAFDVLAELDRLLVDAD